MRYARVSARDVFSALSNPIWASLSIVAAVSLVRLIASVSNFTRPVELLAVETILGGAAGAGVMLALDKQLRGAALGLANRVGWSFPVGNGKNA
jgi:hypothetical protein